MQDIVGPENTASVGQSIKQLGLGEYTHQYLNLVTIWEGLIDEQTHPRSEPDSGNPTVRDRRGLRETWHLKCARPVYIPTKPGARYTKGAVKPVVLAGAKIFFIKKEFQRNLWKLFYV